MPGFFKVRACRSPCLYSCLGTTYHWALSVVRMYVMSDRSFDVCGLSRIIMSDRSFGVCVRAWSHWSAFGYKHPALRTGPLCEIFIAFRLLV